MVFICKTCSKVFKFQSGLSRHNGIHKAFRVFCDCGVSFSRKDNLKVHQFTSSSCRALEHGCNKDNHSVDDDAMTNNLSCKAIPKPSLILSKSKIQSLDNDDIRKIPPQKLKTKHSISRRRQINGTTDILRNTISTIQNGLSNTTIGPAIPANVPSYKANNYNKDSDDGDKDDDFDTHSVKTKPNVKWTKPFPISSQKKQRSNFIFRQQQQQRQLKRKNKRVTKTKHDRKQILISNLQPNINPYLRNLTNQLNNNSASKHGYINHKPDSFRYIGKSLQYLSAKSYHANKRNMNARIYKSNQST
jgi:Zinc finger, C2H2 type